MAIQYDQPGIRYDDASYTYDGHYLGDPLRMDACYLARGRAVDYRAMMTTQRAYRVQRSPRIYLAVLACGERARG